MDKLQLTGQNLGRVFNFRFGHLHAEHFWCYQVKLPNLKMKTRPKQLLRSLLLVIALPGQICQSYAKIIIQADFAGLGWGVINQDATLARWSLVTPKMCYYMSLTHSELD